MIHKLMIALSFLLTSGAAIAALPPVPNAPTDKNGVPIIPHGPAASYMKEAENYLTICLNPDESPKDCHTNQARFEQEYANALSGDYLAQSNVAADLETGAFGSIQKNAIQACAWRLVIMTSGSPYLSDLDTSRTQNACGAVGGSTNPGALSRAKAIKAIIAARKVHSVAVPAIGFDPKRDKDEQSAD